MTKVRAVGGSGAVVFVRSVSSRTVASVHRAKTWSSLEAVDGPSRPVRNEGKVGSFFAEILNKNFQV